MEISDDKNQVAQKLLSVSGELSNDDWKTNDCDYVSKCEITESDVPVLIDMASDWANGEFHEWAYDTEFEYQPIFAWRTLGQLRATEAIEPLLSLSNVLEADGDDWFLEEFPHVFALIGEAALEPLERFLNDAENEHFARSCAANSFCEIGTMHFSLRDRAVAVLTKVLAAYRPGSEELNGTIVSALIDLEAVESASILEKVHSLDLVDTGMCGNWDTVKSQLGIEGTGLLMPEFPHNSIYFGLSPTMAKQAAEEMFVGGELNFDALEQQNDILSRTFQQSPEFKKLKQEFWNWPSTLLEIAANYCGVSFLNIKLRDLNEALFEIVPRKVSTPPESSQQIIDELHHFFAFVARLFDHKQAEVISKSLTNDAANQLREELADSSNFGIAKSMWSQGAAAGFDMTSESEIAQFVSLYNESLNENNAVKSHVSRTMTNEEKKAFNKKRKKQLAQRQNKKKKKKK